MEAGGASSGMGPPQQPSSSSAPPPPPPVGVAVSSAMPAAVGPGLGSVDDELQAEDNRWHEGEAVPLTKRVD
eukprot:15153066-Alexandrium_andersonii.AAC.1